MASSFVVVLDEDVGEEGTERLRHAMLCFKHVIAVDPYPEDFTEHLAQRRARAELLGEIAAILRKGWD